MIDRDRKSPQRCQDVFGAGAIAEGLTHVNEQVLVAGSKDEAAAELERIFAQAVLFVAGGLGATPGPYVVRTEEVEQGGVLQADGLVGCAVFVDEQGKIDLGLLAEETGVACVTQTDDGDARSFFFERRLELAQLRDMLTAEDSTIMTKKDQDGRALGPERAEPVRGTVRVWEGDTGKLAAESFRHAGYSPGGQTRLSSRALHAPIYKEENPGRVVVAQFATSGIWCSACGCVSSCLR